MNTLQKAPTNEKITEYEVNGQQIKLSPSIIRKFLTSGGGNATDQEIMTFLTLCKYQRLNPFLREAYLIKYGNSDATIVTGKEVFTKRARRNANYTGQQAGIVIQKADGTLENRIGTLCLDNEKLVGGWAKIYIKGDEVPTEITVSLNEYIGKKSNGEINSQWSKKPATMIRKVALVQALREAFPEEFQGLYAKEEISDEMHDDVKLDETPINTTEPIFTTAETAYETSEEKSPFDD